MKNRSIQGSLLLLLGAVVWGAAFVAQRAGMDHMPPFAFSGPARVLRKQSIHPSSFPNSPLSSASRPHSAHGQVTLCEHKLAFRDAKRPPKGHSPAFINLFEIWLNVTLKQV